MIKLISILIDYLLGEKKTRFRFNNYTILMIGLSGSGKTSILDFLTKFTIIETTPTIGFNKEIIKYDKYNLTIIDVSGDEQMIPQWKNFYKNIHGLIYVLDNADESKFEKNKNILQDVFSAEQISNLPIVLFANKFEKGQKGIEYLIKHFNLQQQTQRRPLNIQLTNFNYGAGLCEGIEFLIKHMTIEK